MISQQGCKYYSNSKCLLEGGYSDLNCNRIEYSATQNVKSPLVLGIGNNPLSSSEMGSKFGNFEFEVPSIYNQQIDAFCQVSHFVQF